MQPLNTDTLPDIPKTLVDRAKLSHFKTEDDFMGLTIDLTIETGQYVCVAACTTGKEEFWGRDEAAVGGNMVRMYKLIDAMLDETCKRRGEMSFTLARLIFETAVNVQYLIKNFSKELVESYVEHSLRHEKKLWENIAKQIIERNGILLPIEERMQKSIQRAFDASGITLDDVDLKNKSPWGNQNLYEKAKAVELDALYLAAFGGTSHGIHGAWEDIYGNHLNWDGKRFTPNLSWGTPRPQLLLSLCPVIIETVLSYFRFVSEGLAEHLFRERLEDLVSRIWSVNSAHEAYLSGKTWPEI